MTDTTVDQNAAHPAFFNDGTVTVHHGDSLAVLRTLADNSVDSICTDPPYGLSKEPDIAEVLTHWLAGDDYVHTGSGFMTKMWDSFVPGPSVWREAFRVLKPGGYGLVFSATRTCDLMTIALRMAGFEIRDQISWVQSQGFPKSMDAARAINQHLKTSDSPQAAAWNGFGTALKPTHEMITLVRKPLEGTVAANLLKHGVGALNIDACRVKSDSPTDADPAVAPNRSRDASATRRVTDSGGTNFAATPGPRGGDPAGRFPPNVLLTHHRDCVTQFTDQTVGLPGQCVTGCPVAELDAQSGMLKSGANNRVGAGVNNGAAYGAESRKPGTQLIAYGDEGGASRFFPRFHPGNPVDLFEASLTSIDQVGDLNAVSALVPWDDQDDLDALSDVDGSAFDEDLGWDEPMLPVQTGDYAPFMYAKKAKGAERSTVYVPDTGCRPAGERQCGPDPHNPATNPDDAASATARTCDTCGTPWVTYQHPTVKPLGGTDGTGLMPWLISLVTPKGGTTLDLYAGTGTTGLAAARNGYQAIVIERDPVHVFMVRQRLTVTADPGPMKRARAAERSGSPATPAAANSPAQEPLTAAAAADDTPDLFTLFTTTTKDAAA